MRLALGERGASLIAVGIAISTLGFLSQGMLTAPRVYFAMAEDGLFFKRVAWLDPRTRVPVVAIALQGVLAVVIALSGRYEQILNYVISVDFVWFGLTAVTLFVFRKIGPSRTGISAKIVNEPGEFRVPGHPWTTGFFVAACALVVAATVYNYPRNSVIGWIILVTGVPIYFFWRWWRVNGTDRINRISQD
jgi:APA family basic amino acid/polyamine antiporter